VGRDHYNFIIRAHVCDQSNILMYLPSGIYAVKYIGKWKLYRFKNYIIKTKIILTCSRI